MNFDTMSKDEIVAFFAEMDGQSFDEFACEPAFKIAFEKFIDDNHPDSFSRVPEEIAVRLWLRMLAKYCAANNLQRQIGVLFDLKRIKMWAPEFKRIWDATPYKSFKDLLSQYICEYYAEVAEYMIMNNVEINGHGAPFLSPSTMINLVDNPAVLAYAANQSNHEKIRELAQEKIKRSVPNERIWSYRVIGREEVEVGIEFS